MSTNLQTKVQMCSCSSSLSDEREFLQNVLSYSFRLEFNLITASLPTYYHCLTEKNMSNQQCLRGGNKYLSTTRMGYQNNNSNWNEITKQLKQTQRSSETPRSFSQLRSKLITHLSLQIKSLAASR